MAGWFKALTKTREKFTAKIAEVFTGKTKLDEATLEEIESTLLGADLPPRLVGELVAELEKKPKAGDASVTDRLEKILVDALGAVEGPESWIEADAPTILLIVGINGSGKTTSAAKIAHRLKNSGVKVLLGAGDTFRAAGSDQLRLWGDRVGCPVIYGQTGADAASVAYDVVDAAIARTMDVAVIDTAGRMHTKQPLMEELDKVCRAMQKRHPNSPHQTWIVLDGMQGQNALAQVKLFNQIVPLTGIVVTKLDGSSKAGFLFAVKKELNVPVRFVGLGEHEDDLVPFDPVSFVEALLGRESESSLAETS